MESKHTHEFVIPVEFEHYDSHTLYNGSGVTNNALTKTRVTVLRCLCGKEINRGDEDGE